jgi:putative transposase
MKCLLFNGNLNINTEKGGINMTEDDKIAIFKYGIIAPVLNDSAINQTRYFQKAAELEYDYPGRMEKVRFNFRTFKKWLHIYRKNGYEGLKPLTRADKGKPRKIPDDIRESIMHLCKEYEFKTISNLYRYLVNNDIIEYENFTEVTLRNFLRANKISFRSNETKPRKAFEAPHINILWTADFMHGPYVSEGKRKYKTYLCAIIDDYSRVITGGYFYPEESSLSLQKTLKQAVLTYGIPDRFYCDNGKVFSSGYIHMVCAKLGTALIHSKPYDSPSRGKIERFFRTVRDMFIPNLYIGQKADNPHGSKGDNGSKGDTDSYPVDANTINSNPTNSDPNSAKIFTLKSLNNSFKLWLLDEYNNNSHKGIPHVSPMDRYLDDIVSE